MSADIRFDNFYVGHDADTAAELAAKVSDVVYCCMCTAGTYGSTVKVPSAGLTSNAVWFIVA